MTTRPTLIACLAAAAVSAAAAQDVSLEYQVKAAYLYNFTKFVEWPAGAVPPDAPFTICVAETSPFGPALAKTVASEFSMGRPLATRVVQDAGGPCQVLFIPRGVPPAPYLKRLRAQPVLTVGESPDFLSQGGTINFVIDRGKVRFEINQEAAEHAQLKISSRLMRLAKRAGSEGVGE